MDKTELIKKLVSLWYECLVDHHKDRDCHFYIGQKYSYNGQLVYYVEHNGYLQDYIYETFFSFDDAQKWLIEFLKNIISIEATLWIEDERDYIYPETVNNLKKVLEQLKELS